MTPAFFKSKALRVFCGITCLILLFSAGPIAAQVDDGIETYSKEELLNRLKTKEGKLALNQARADMERAEADYQEAQTLYDRKVYTATDLQKYKRGFEQATLAHEKAKIDLEKTRLTLLKDATLVTVVDAKKYRRMQDDQVMVSIALRNDSDINQARIAMEREGGESGRDVSGLLTIENVVVTLKGTVQMGEPGTGRMVQAVVGDPFQQIVPKLDLGQEKVLQFILLKKEVEDVTLELNYLGEIHAHNLFLKKESTEDLPTINSSQYSQLGMLGTTLKYDLKLERLAKTEQSFSLLTLNLPKELSFAFSDPKSGAKITNVKFDEQNSKLNLNFELSIPEKLDQKFIDQSIDFTIVVCRQEEVKNIYELKKKFGDQRIPAEDLAKIKGDATDLVVIPKGRGELEIMVANLYKEIKQGDPAQVKISIMNAGTMTLRNVVPEVEFPLEWEGVIEPKEIAAIEPGQKIMIKVETRPPEDVTVGEYAMKLTAKGQSGMEAVEAVNKNFTLRVAAESNILGTLILVTILIGAVVGIAVASVKIARR